MDLTETKNKYSKVTINKYEKLYNKHKDILKTYINKEPRALYTVLTKLTYIKGTKNPVESKYSHSGIVGIMNAFIYQMKIDKTNDKIIDKYINFVTKMRRQKELEEDIKIVQNITVDPKLKTLDHYKQLLIDYEKVDKQNFNYRYWVIANLYVTDEQTRRILDYAKMKLADKLSDTTDNNYNYFVKSSNMFIFNVYKTANVYGQEKVKVSKKLSTILRDYIYKSNITNGDLMFNNEMLINRAINAVFKTTVNHLRKARTMDNNKNMTKQSLISSARNMQHNINTEVRNYLK